MSSLATPGLDVEAAAAAVLAGILGAAPEHISSLLLPPAPASASAAPSRRRPAVRIPVPDRYSVVSVSVCGAHAAASMPLPVALPPPPPAALTMPVPIPQLLPLPSILSLAARVPQPPLAAVTQGAPFALHPLPPPHAAPLLELPQCSGFKRRLHEANESAAVDIADGGSRGGRSRRRAPNVQAAMSDMVDDSEACDGGSAGDHSYRPSAPVAGACTVDGGKALRHKSTEVLGPPLPLAGPYLGRVIRDVYAAATATESSAASTVSPALRSGSAAAITSHSATSAASAMMTAEAVKKR